MANKKLKTIDDKLDYINRLAVETWDLHVRGHEWDFQQGVKALKRAIDDLAEQVGK